MDDVALNKSAIIERCLGGVREEHDGDDRSLDNLTQQDAIVLNLQRAGEASIELGMHLVRRYLLGIPQDGRDVFVLLVRGASLNRGLATRLERMVGFRNIAVHDYQALHLDVVRAIIR